MLQKMDFYPGWIPRRLVWQQDFWAPAGRPKDSIIDMSAGIYLKKKIGDTVKKGEPIAICYAGTKEKLNCGMAMFESSIRYSKEAPRIPKLIVDIIR